MEDPYGDFMRTVKSLVDVLEFSRIYCKKAKIILTSSAAVYGNAETMPLHESMKPLPLSPYGHHKWVAEQLCESYAKNFGVSVTVVRFFSIYGIGLRKQLLWDACRKIITGNMIFSGTGDETRDWIHVTDAATLLCHLKDHITSECAILNGATGTGTSVRDILQELAIGLGLTEEIGFNSVVRPGNPLHYIADIEGVRKLGWAPQRHWRQGVREYAEWFRSLD
jgi:UDP-glucose 4-epimerase